MRIDIHTHFLCLDFVKHLQGRAELPRTVLDGGTYVVDCGPGLRLPTSPKIVDMDLKLRDMDEMNIDLAVLSHGIPGPDVLDGFEADEWAMRINDDLARVISTYPHKFVGWGVVGFGDPGRSVAEVDRCVRQLGFKGIQLFSNLHGRLLDTPEFMPVYRHIADLGVPINMHPAAPLNVVGFDRSSLQVALGFVCDTGLNTLRLIQSGLFDDVPHLALIVPHVGGVIPYLHGRIEAYSRSSSPLPDQRDLAHPIGQYLENLYVDTVCYHIEALEYCYGFLGPERLLYGTDHPFGPYETAAEIVEALDCPDAHRELIYHGNARRLLRID